MLKKMLIKFALICTVLSAPGYADNWQSENTKSRLQYTASFEQAPVSGAFKEFSVVYSVDEKGKPTRLAVKVSVASVDMGDSDINAVIRGSEWFNVTQYPHAFFASDNFAAIINSEGDNEFIATGILQLKGTKRSVSVPFSWQEISDKKSSMTGSLTLNRADFSIGSGEWANAEQIGLAVEVGFEILLTRSAKE